LHFTKIRSFVGPIARAALFSSRNSERRAKQDGTSVNQVRRNHRCREAGGYEYGRIFAERRARADFIAFDRLMRCRGGESPAPDGTIA